MKCEKRNDMLELNHKNRDFWKVGIKFVIFIYEITEKFPKSELYGPDPETQQLSEEDFTKFLVLLWLSSIRKSKLHLD